MPRESCPGLLLTLVSVFLGLCESSAAGRAAVSDTQQAQPQQQMQPQSQQQHTVCKPGLEFWSAERTSCSPCTRCAPEFTLTPCMIHKNAVCGPLSALEFDWSFLSSTRARKRPSRAGDDDGAVTPNLFLQFSEKRTKERSLVEASSLVNLDHEDNENLGNKKSISSLQESKTAYDSRERKKLAAEDNLPLDWQTGALVLAVCACVVFFLVAGCSALIYARQWRRMKRNFEPAGLEEISARLNLMVKAELAELVAGAPMNPGDPETRCQYLEKLLDRKRETSVVATAVAVAVAGWPETASGNLYIEEGGTITPKSKRSQIAQIHNIETIFNYKTSPGTN